jgi:hypothetical protein
LCGAAVKRAPPQAAQAGRRRLRSVTLPTEVEGLMSSIGQS